MSTLTELRAATDAAIAAERAYEPAKPPPPPPPSEDMLMGVSNSKHTHGGYQQWHAVRVYQFGQAIGVFTEYGQPKVIALTDSATNLQGGAASATALSKFLQTFYEASGAEARRGCEIHFANSNEYGDKVSNQAAFADTVHRMYDVIHSTDGQGNRRWPNASMWLDPTHYQEKNGLIEKSLMPVAKWLDGIGWSMYPPGRESTSVDPTFTKPGRNAAAKEGHLERCFQRTLAAQEAAGHPLQIACWEIGIGDDPDDKDHRPYYAVHSMARWCYERAADLKLQMPLMLWWDNEVAGGNSQNILTDEPTSTSPSTATAWRTWKELVPEHGGKKPGNWPDAPKSSWPTGA